MLDRIERALKIFLVLAFILFAISLTGVITPAFQLAQTWQTPLGPRLDLPTRAATDALPQNQPATNITQTSPGTPGLEPLNVNNTCGGPNVMTILAIGADTRGYNYLYGLADVIRIVRVDFVNARVAVLEFPRDLWVEIPGIEEHHDITHEKLNQAYLYGNPGFGYYNGPDQGPGLLARTLDLNFGMRPDHYVAVNMHTFERIVDTVGGIDVYLPHTVDARAADQKERYDLVFDQGHHHLAGKEALMLARLRVAGVFDRANNQDIILCALRKELLSPNILPKLPDIIDTFDGAVQMDFTPEELSQLSCLAPFIRPENIAFASFPAEMFTGTRIYDPIFDSRVFIWDVDFNLMRAYVAAFNAGTWPEASPVSGTPTSAETSAFTCP
jgi:LCP family protein required for cell wall assembly